MKRTLQYHVTGADLPATVHQFLRGRGYSRHILASLKPHPDAVLLNGAHVFFKTSLSDGDVLTVTVRDEISSVNIAPAPVPFSIVYEDADLMVINKPANVSILPAINHPADTLANGVAELYRQRGIPYVFRSINRLDRDTTGLLILANNVLSASILEGALQRRAIRRTYLAIAEGETPEAGTIDLPIGRVSDSLIERCVDPEHGDRAVTHYRRLQAISPVASGTQLPGGGSPDACSLLALHLETGRTHQIRVHMAAIGHPLLGDTLYNPRAAAALRGISPDCTRPSASAENPTGTICISRQALHAWKLDFRHPITGEPMHFEAPVPPDMTGFLGGVPMECSPE